MGAPTTNGELDYTYMGVKFSRPFHWYLDEDADPAPPPPNDGEKWIVDLLKPVLEGMYVEKRRGGEGREEQYAVWCVLCCTVLAYSTTQHITQHTTHHSPRHTTYVPLPSPLFLNL